MRDAVRCRDMEELIVPLVDGQLDPEDERRCREHLACCASCRDEVDEHRRLLGILAELPEAPLASVVLRVEAARARERARRRIARWASRAAAVLIAAGAAWFGFRAFNAPPEQELLSNLGMVEEYAALVDAGGEDLFSDLEIVRAVVELSQETIPQEY